jgi:molybdopterin biosynthesis enzyme MoaB
MQIAQRLIPGIPELMRLKSLEKTPMASLSRAVAGIRGRTLIINLPGSPRGALENLEAVWPVIGHAVEKIRGDERDCGDRFQR